VDGPAIRFYIIGMRHLACRRLIALAVAYAVALNLVLPLAAPLARAADAMALSEICATGDSLPETGVPNSHGSACPLGLACSHDFGANGFLALGPRAAEILVPRSMPLSLSVRLDDEARVARDIGAWFARAPPPV
jgi:hypothetical protein